MAIQLWWIPAISFVVVFILAVVLLRIFVTDPESRMRVRLQTIKSESAISDPAALIRDKYLRHLSPAERVLEGLPGMAKIAQFTEQAGYRVPAYRLMLLAIGLAMGGFFGVWSLIHSVPFGILAALAVSTGFTLWISSRRSQRMRQFEEQLPDVLDTMARALRAGNSLLDTFKFISEEMDDPVSSEFNNTWSHLNYGISLKATLDDLLFRMPSTSLQALVTAIIIQRETGGNLSEILDKLGDVLRTKFRFQRRVRTLTAEGRMSAWVLTLMPGVLAGVLTILQPDYLPRLYNDPRGPHLIMGAMVMMAIGIFWVRRVVRIRL